MKKQLCSLALVCLSSVSAFAGFGGYSQQQAFRLATPEELAMKSVPDAPGAEAVMLDWVRVDEDPSSYSAEYHRIKVLTDEGKKHGDVEIVYVPGYPYNGRVTDIDARTIRPDGTVVPFNGKVYDKVVFKSGRQAVKAKAFSLSEVQPGSILEYRFIRRWSDSLLLNSYWLVQKDIPVAHAKLTLKPYDSQGQFGSFFTYIGLPQGKVPVKVRDRYELELVNMPALRIEEYMPPAEQLRARVNFFYTDSNVRMDKFWPAQAATFAREIEKYIGKSKTANEMASTLSAATKDRTELLRKLYAHAQTFRNLSFEAAKTEQEINRQDLGESKNAEEVLRKKAGYAHEINRAFVAMARSAGFEADAMRVAPRDEFFFSDTLPDADQMSGEVTVVMLDGKPVYLDPGTPFAPFGVLSWEKSNVASIRITKGGPVWGNTPLGAAGEASTRRQAELTLTDQDTLDGKITVAFAGQEALVRRLSNYGEDEAARKKALEDEVKQWFPDGATLKLTSLTGDAAATDALTATFDVVLPNVASRAGSRVVVTPSVFETTAKNPFAPTTRQHPVYFPYPHVEIDEIKLTVPESLAVATLPPPANLNAGAAVFTNEVKRNGNVLTFKRSKTVDTMVVDAKYYNALRKFYSAILTADQQPLVFTPAAGGAQ
ncbi:MAG TPA: DUF3857 domain-containing protein [Thermoanaerobaculia bacterium]|nr:DUF3857 domain-containing protein [Thermoanaerobaculia bacterium]